MATIATVEGIRDSIETDVADSVLQRLIDSEELSIREQLTTTHRAQLPVIIWTGRYTPTLGSSADLMLASSILAANWVRIEGTVSYNSDTPDFTADTMALDTDGGSDTMTPLLADGTSVPAGVFTVTIDDTGKELTFDATATTAAIVITRILSLTTQEPSPQLVSALIELVELSLRNRSLQSERVGQYAVTFRDFQTEKWAVLRRLVLSSDESIAY